MLKLVVGDLFTNARVWLGAFLSAAATAVTAALCASLVETALRVRGAVGLALSGIGGTVLVFSAIAAVVVLGTIANLTVALQRRDYALWQLVGVLPNRVGLVVTTQLFVVAVLGGVLGCLVAAPALQPFYDYAFDGNDDLEGLRISFGAVSVAVVIGLVSVLVMLSGTRAAGRAARVSPLESLREPELPGLRTSPLRRVGGGVLLLIVAAIAQSLRNTPVDRLTVPLMLLAPLTAAALAAVGPAVFGRVLGGWTTVVPPSASASWFLARSAARHNLSRSSAAISSLMIAIALVGGLYSATGTVSGKASTGSVVLILGGPLVLSLLGAAVSVAMASRTREREGALVRAAGSTAGVVVAAAAWEAVIYLGTALILALVSVAVTALVGAWAAGVAPAWGLGAIAATTLCGLLLMLAATVLPTALGARRPVTESLAAE